MSDEEKQLTIRMPKSLHKTLKLLCTEEDIVINNAANEAIEDWIAKRKAAKTQTTTEEAKRSA